MEEENKPVEETKDESQQETVETKTESTESTPEKVEKTVPLSVLIAERQKRQEAQRQLDALSIRQVQPQQQQRVEEETPPDEYDIQGQIKWGIKEALKQRDLEQKQNEQRTQTQTRLEKGLSSVKNAAAVLSVEDPEFEIKLDTARSKGMNLPNEHEALIGESSDPQGMLKYLIANPSEAIRIQSMDVVGAAREITRLEAKLTQSSPQKKSPPPPLETARGSRKEEPSGVIGAAKRLFGEPA